MRNPVQAEQQALQTIQAHWRGKMFGRGFSPLENLDGTNPILETLQELQDSPLCMAGTWGKGIDRPANVLRQLKEIYEDALIPWERLRTVQPPECFSLVAADDPSAFVCNHPSIYNRWPYGTFPREVRREVQYRFRELVSTSRFAVGDHPSEHALLEVNPIYPPLQFAHVACLAAIVLIWEALKEYLKILEEWEQVVEQAAQGLPYTWLLQSDPGRVERILSAHLSRSLDASAVLRLQTVEIRAKTDCAGAWLELANMSDDHRSEIEVATIKATTQAVAQTMQAAKNAKSEQARTNAKKARSKVTAEDWAQYLSKRSVGRGGMDATMQDFADRRGVSLRTVYRRHEEAKEKNLLS